MDGAPLVGWLRRAAALVPLKDRVELLTPPILLEKFIRYGLAGRKRDAAADDPDARDPELVGLLLDFFRAAGHHYFRLEVRGVDNVPPEGPVLLVGNHNGALLPTDGFFTALAIWDRFGPARAVHPLAHDFLFYDATLRRYAQRLGMLRAGHEGARRERGRVILGDRKGFLRLALSQRVPIVPVVSVGTHEQLVVLTRGDRLARILHMHRWARTFCCPIVLSMPWGITSGFVPYLPLPAQTTVAFGRPMTWPDLDPRDAGDAEAIDRVYGEVEASMQTMLDELSAGRRPFLGQPRRPYQTTAS
jgi:1-acyl-sn-glycerol-3-phosphate acyltransferase